MSEFKWMFWIRLVVLVSLCGAQVLSIQWMFVSPNVDSRLAVLVSLAALFAYIQAEVKG